MKQEEIWREIEGHVHYEVSSQGRVKRRSYSCLCGRWKKKGVISRPECFCKIHNKNGRAIVFIDTEGRNVDELVAMAFLGYGADGYKKIIHKNGDPMDCRKDNLLIGRGSVPDNNDATWINERETIKSLYEITRDGVVIRLSNGHVYKPSIDSKGYQRMRLPVPFSENPDGRKPFKVHRLVAMMHLPDYSPDLQVNHKNGDKCDNRVENLEMVSNSENAAHAWRNIDKSERSKRMRSTRHMNHQKKENLKL